MRNYLDGSPMNPINMRFDNSQPGFQVGGGIGMYNGLNNSLYEPPHHTPLYEKPTPIFERSIEKYPPTIKPNLKSELFCPGNDEEEPLWKRHIIPPTWGSNYNDY